MAKKTATKHKTTRAKRANKTSAQRHGGATRAPGHLRDLASAPARAAEVLAADEAATPAAARRGASAGAQRAGAAARATSSTRPGAQRPTPPSGGLGSGTLPPRVARLTAPVGVVLHDARELFENARRAGTKLVRGGLDPKLLKELPQRIALVADAQKAWERQQSRSTPASLRAAREEARALKTDMLAAGRYVLRKDAAAQRELDAIAEGDGLDDLISDLRTLADFYERRADMLDHADVSDDAVERARELATRLRLFHEKAPVDPRVQEAHAHRNRALAMLEEAVSEVRAAGRYVFRDAPARLALFRHEFQRAHDARVSARKKK